MSAPQVTLDIDLTPQPVQGFAYLYPTVQVTDPSEGITLTTVPEGTAFQGSQLSIPIYATDNANMSPAGWAWFLDFSQNPYVPGKPAPVTFFAPAGPLSFTATNASPCVFTPTFTAAFNTAFPNGLPNGSAMTLAGGSLPTGFTAATTYYVVNSAPTTFQLSATRGGSAINSSGSGSGTLTMTRYTYSGLVPQTSSVTFLPYPQTLIVTDKGGQVYNVKAYGAKANGVTDDHVAIQAAITAAHAAGGGIVYLPAGSYFIGSRITPASNVVIQGAGINNTTLISGVASDYVFYASNSGGLSDITVRDLTINVNNISNGSALRLEYITRGLVERIRILNVPSGGWGAVIGASGSAATTNAYINFNVKFKDCFFDTQNSTLEMLLIMNAQHVQVTNCDFYNNIASSGPGIGVYQVCDDVKITHCNFRAIGGAAIYYSLSTNNVTIDDCAFYGSSAGNGIQGANLSDNGAFSAGWAYGITVTNCYFTGLVVGLQIGAVKGALVDNCYFESNYNIGINIAQGNQGVSATPLFWTISNCRFRNNNQQANNAAIHPGILLTQIGGSQYGKITHCSFWDDGAGGVHTQNCPVTFSGALTWDYIDINHCYFEQYQNSNVYQQIFLDSGAATGSNVIISNSRLSNGSTVLVQSGAPGVINSQSSSYSVLPTDGTVLATGGAGGITVTLPAVATVTGQRFTIIKADNGAGAITVATTSSQTINGATTQTLASQYNKITVQSDGTKWWIINT